MKLDKRVSVNLPTNQWGKPEIHLIEYTELELHQIVSFLYDLTKYDDRENISSICAGLAAPIWKKLSELAKRRDISKVMLDDLKEYIKPDADTE